MKKVIPFVYAILLIVIAGSVLPSFVSKTEKSIVIKQERETPAFDRISVSGSMDVNITQGPQRIDLKGDKELIENIKTEVVDGELQISFFRSNNENYGEKMNSVKIEISVPELNEIKRSGSGDITGSGEFTSHKNFAVSVAGSGDIIFTIQSPETSVQIAGSGDVVLKGSSENTNIQIAGSGDFVGDKFSTKDASVSIAGSGDAILHIDENLQANIVGSGDIIYSGNPKIESNKIGSGDIVNKGR